MSATISNTVTATYTLAQAATTIAPGGEVRVAIGTAIYGAAAATEWLVVNETDAGIYGTAAGVSIANAPGVVFNAGSIGAAPGADAVLLAPGFNNRVVVVPGAIFGGTVDGGNPAGGSAMSTLELAVGTGTLNGLGSRYVNFSNVTIDVDGIWSLGGDNNIATGVTLNAAGSAGGFVDAGYLANAGIIDAQVDVAAGAVLTNASAGTIDGGGFRYPNGVVFDGANASFINAGLVQALSVGVGVTLRAGGTVTNLAGAGISSSLDAVSIEGGPAAITNAGEITGNFAVGLEPGGSVVNQSGGTIFGLNVAVYFGGGPGVVSNAGTIKTLPVMKTIGVWLRDGGMISNAAAGTIEAATAVSISGGGATVVNAGLIGSDYGQAIIFSPGYENRLVVEPYSHTAGTVDGGNTVGGAAVSMLELATGVGTLDELGTLIENFGSIQFDPGAAWRLSGSPAALAGGEMISGFAPGDAIDLVGVSETISGDAAGTLVLGGSQALDLLLPGTTGAFGAVPSADGTEITVACFVAGTRILSADGNVLVEELRIGARLPTTTGRLTRIIWLGHQRAGAPPVRVRAGAFGRDVPVRDLLLSPDHAVFLDGALVPVRHLINGRTIVREQADEVTYYHVEFAAHDVILAEGLPCESYLDTGNRGAFQSAENEAALRLAG